MIRIHSEEHRLQKGEVIWTEHVQLLKATVKDNVFKVDVRLRGQNHDLNVNIDKVNHEMKTTTNVAVTKQTA